MYKVQKVENNKIVTPYTLCNIENLCRSYPSDDVQEYFLSVAGRG